MAKAKSEQQRQIQPSSVELSNTLATPSGKAPARNQMIAGSLLAVVLIGGAGLIFYPATNLNTDTQSPTPEPINEPPPESAQVPPTLIIPGLSVPGPVTNASPEAQQAQRTIIRQQMLAYSASATGAAALAQVESAQGTPEPVTDVAATPVPEQRAEPSTQASIPAQVPVTAPQPLDVSPAISTPFLHEIPGLRAQVPELQVSVSIYSNRPASRRARINGTMYYEGDSLTPSLVLDEIRPGTLVFNFKGTPFQISP